MYTVQYSERMNTQENINAALYKINFKLEKRIF